MSYLQFNRKQETLLWTLVILYTLILFSLLLNEVDNLFSQAVVITLIFGTLGTTALYALRTETRYIRQWRQIKRLLKVLGYCSAAVGALTLLIAIAGIVFQIQDNQKDKQLKNARLHLSIIANVAATYKQEVEKLDDSLQVAINENIKKAWAGERVAPIRPIVEKDGKVTYTLTDFF